MHRSYLSRGFEELQNPKAPLHSLPLSLSYPRFSRRGATFSPLLALIRVRYFCSFLLRPTLFAQLLFLSSANFEERGAEDLPRGRMGAASDEKMVEHVAAGEEGYASDSDAFSSVHYVLDSVRMASF